MYSEGTRADLTVAAETSPRAALPASAALRPLAWILITIGAVSAAADPDLWGHLRFGLDTIHSGRLSTIDPYSFTQDVPWINHEWLSEALMGAAYTAAGPFGLVFLKAAQLICVFALMVTALRHADYGRRWGSLALAG